MFREAVELLVDDLEVVLGGGFEEQDLVRVVAVVRQVAAFFADEFFVHDAKCDIRLEVVVTDDFGRDHLLIVSVGS